ncbi:SirB2 family protein [Salinisphaera orenii]|uniref:SirB2 family protein n=1 Tax=Salinisphaera orenii TaxID=856731 RepID=UPI000DBE89DE
MDIGTVYTATKTMHVACVGLSGGLFAGRAGWVIATRRGLWRWLKVVPHCVDTVLLASGLTLAFLIHQYPFAGSDWLTAKVIGLFAYIALGVMVFRGSRQQSLRMLFSLAALLVFAYIVSVAVTKQPAGFVVGLF